MTEYKLVVVGGKLEQSEILGGRTQSHLYKWCICRHGRCRKNADD